MGRIQQTAEEVEVTKQKILENAISIIIKNGYEGLTMKKLAKSMGVAAPGIYYYFANKEEIFLSARRQGFLLLYELAKRAYDSHTDPFVKLQAFTKDFIDFALNNPNYYKIMLTMDVPMYPSFEGTPLQATAFKVMEASMPAVALGVKVMEELAETYHPFPKEQAHIQFMIWLSGMHGIVALYNNRILSILHKSPEDVINLMADHFLTIFKSPEMS